MQRIQMLCRTKKIEINDGKNGMKRERDSKICMYDTHSVYASFIFFAFATCYFAMNIMPFYKYHTQRMNCIERKFNRINTK